MKSAYLLSSCSGLAWSEFGKGSFCLHQIYSWVQFQPDSEMSQIWLGQNVGETYTLSIRILGFLFTLLCVYLLPWWYSRTSGGINPQSVVGTRVTTSWLVDGNRSDSCNCLVEPFLFVGKLVFVNVLHSLLVYEKLPSQWNMNVKSLSFLKCVLVTFSVLPASGELDCPVFTGCSSA